MRNADNFETNDGSFCRCCGSRNVMTLDTSIRESSDWEHQSRLRKARLWHAIGGLSEAELSEFVLDAVPCVNVEEDYEVEFGLHSYLTDWDVYAPDPNGSASDGQDIDLGEIETMDSECMLKERKGAFLKLWKSFDPEIKASFLRFASREVISSGDNKC